MVMKKDMREKILKIAIKLFAQKGFFKTTVDDIAHSARVAKGTIYLYFRDKSDIYIGIIESQLNSALADLTAIDKEKMNSTQKLRKIAENWLSHSVEFHQLFPMISMENINQALKIMKEIKPRVFPIIAQIISSVARIIEEGIRNGEFHNINPQVAAISFLNIVRTPFLVNLFSSEKVKCGSEILDLFFDGLLDKKRS